MIPFSCVGGISDVRSISGLITSVCQVYFRYESSPVLSPTQFHPPDDYKSDYTFVILLACVLVGIMLGVGVAIGCVSKMFNSNQTVGKHLIIILILTINIISRVYMDSLFRQDSIRIWSLVRML